MRAPREPETVELRPHGMAAGGEAVAREGSGRVVFVRGALPGETVRVRMVDERDRFARAVVEEVVEPVAGRVEPPCEYVAAGCGGCSWQHIAPDVQRALKRQIVLDALERVGRVDRPVVELGPELAVHGFRTTVRLAVIDHRLGYRQARSHDVVPVARCLVAHPALEEIIRDARFPGADEVTLRCSAASGERLARVVPEEAAPSAVVPRDVQLGREAMLHEVVAGRRLQISARSFFQTRPDGAEALVAAVGEAAGEALDAPVVVDAYGGVGLFSACLPRAGRVVVIESSASSCRDAEVNLADHRASVVRVDVARWRPEPAGLVIADPPRTGLGRAATVRLSRSGAPRLVLVSCDPVAMARDVALLEAEGYRHQRTTLIDLFPHTPHVEAVTRLDRIRD
ncbi:MAG TPA: TRAM domain-containing protein [Acidimicrobiales bacterium]